MGCHRTAPPIVTVFRYRSPCGILCYRWQNGVCEALWLNDLPGACEANDDPVRRWLEAYFRATPAPPPPLAQPRTPFQARLRGALLEIPFGQTQTYGELAEHLGTAPRAVGQALRANPLPLLVPCHRVVAADGLGGFSCGAAWKRRLLAFEQGASRLLSPGSPIA